MAESMMTPAILEAFHARHEADFAYSLPGTGRFRVNAYYQRSSVALAMRRVRSTAATVERAGPARGGQPAGRGDARPGAGHRSDRVGQDDHPGRHGRPHQPHSVVPRRHHRGSGRSICT